MGSQLRNSNIKTGKGKKTLYKPQTAGGVFFSQKRDELPPWQTKTVGENHQNKINSIGKSSACREIEKSKWLLPLAEENPDLNSEFQPPSAQTQKVSTTHLGKNPNLPK